MNAHQITKAPTRADADFEARSRVYHEFPKVLYHSDGVTDCKVHSRDEARALGPDWHEKPQPKPVAAPGPAAPTLDELRAENAQLRNELAAETKGHAETKEYCMELGDQIMALRGSLKQAAKAAPAAEAGSADPEAGEDSPEEQPEVPAETEPAASTTTRSRRNQAKAK